MFNIISHFYWELHQITLKSKWLTFTSIVGILNFLTLKSLMRFAFPSDKWESWSHVMEWCGLKTVSKIGSVAFPDVLTALFYICSPAGVFNSLQSSLCFQTTAVRTKITLERDFCTPDLVLKKRGKYFTMIAHIIQRLCRDGLKHTDSRIKMPGVRSVFTA